MELCPKLRTQPTFPDFFSPRYDDRRKCSRPRPSPLYDTERPLMFTTL